MEGQSDTTTEAHTVSAAADGQLHGRQSTGIMLVIGLCACAISGIAVASFCWPAQDWQLAKDALVALGAIASSLSTGYFALQKGSRA